jgi:leader peptidase (prepilin peptidase)/N-methyltransferase
MSRWVSTRRIEYLRKRPLKATAFLPFGLFLVPAIWIGWLVEALLD